MRPKLQILDEALKQQIIAEAFELLMDPGVRVHNPEALGLLADAGCRVDIKTQIAHIPEHIVRRALETAPSEFYLYSLDGEPAVRYGGMSTHFNPCSTALTILDSETQRQRAPITEDMVKFVKLVEALPQLDAQSTALLCSDVPKEIADLYRLYIALNYMRKPIVTGAFEKETLWIMKDLLVAAVGDERTLAEKPVAVFDVCPSPPLLWGDLQCQNLIDCARSFIPTQLISMPLAGATSPVTLAAAVAQNAAENMSGITICQLAQAGAPVIWGGSPAAFDMRNGTTPMGAVETWMIDMAYVEVGKAMDMPTNTYMGLSDSKIVDTQCGLEAAGGILLAALIGVNMVSSPGMMDFESCQSFEKVVIDSEIIGMAKRLIGGVEAREIPVALTLMRDRGHRADYLAQRHTRKWFREELYMPSELIDRKTAEAWEKSGATSMLDRARTRVNKLVESFEPAPVSRELRDTLREITTKAAQQFGMDALPPLPLD